MLARMLRFTLAMQMVLGAVLGHWLGSAWPAMLGAALALPVASNLGVVLWGFAKSRGAAPLGLWLQALLGEAVSSLQFFLLRQPWTWGQPELLPGSGATPRVPVLLVHGLGCNHRVWDLLLPALQQQGHTVLAVDLEPPFCSIDDYASTLEQAVQTLRQHSGQNQVALLGHSMGGVAIRAWMRRHGTAHVARVVTLGSPHAGTRAKGLVDTANGLQMAWNSDWLQALAASESTATRALFRIGISAQDNVVYPQADQTLAGVQPKVFEGVGHLQLCRDAAVRQWVCAQLLLG